MSLGISNVAFRRLSCGLIACLALTAGCASSTTTVSPQTPDPVVVAGRVSQAIDLDYRQSVLPSGYVAGGLSDVQRQALRKRIVDAYEGYYTGDQLHQRLTAMLAWADEIAGAPNLRSTAVTLSSFKSQVDMASFPVLSVTGSYDVFLVNERGSGVSLSSWGGTLSMTFAANLERVGGAWLVSNLTQWQGNFVPDPSARRTGGVDRVPSPSPSGK